MRIRFQKPIGSKGGVGSKIKKGASAISVKPIKATARWWETRQLAQTDPLIRSKREIVFAPDVHSHDFPNCQNLQLITPDIKACYGACGQTHCPEHKLMDLTAKSWHLVPGPPSTSLPCTTPAGVQTHQLLCEMSPGASVVADAIATSQRVSVALPSRFGLSGEPETEQISAAPEQQAEPEKSGPSSAVFIGCMAGLGALVFALLICVLVQRRQASRRRRLS